MSACIGDVESHASPPAVKSGQDFDLMSLLNDPSQQQNQGPYVPSQLPYFVALPKQRRKRQPWSDDETKRLLRGVHLFGKGNWAIIHQQMGFVDTRTTTDLKDKWRNLIDPRKNARTPKDLKQLADIINKEQDSITGMNRAVLGYVARPQAQGVSSEQVFQHGDGTRQPQAQEGAPAQGVFPRLFEIAESEMMPQNWDSIQFQDDWEHSCN